MLPEHHRAGIGRAVRTAAQFRLASGRRPLEDMPALWEPDQPALQVTKAVPPQPLVVRSPPDPPGPALPRRVLDRGSALGHDDATGRIADDMVRD